MEIYTNTSTAISAWAPTGCVSPMVQLQGSGLSFAASAARVITDGTGLPVAAKGRHMTDAYPVPDPRGRKR